MSQWVSIIRAAEILGEASPEALRRKFDRASHLSDNGVVEANIDGVRARKFGRIWKVQLSAAWAG